MRRLPVFVFLFLLSFPVWAQDRVAPDRPTSPMIPDIRGYTTTGGLTPIPDPTTLTTQLVDRALSASKLEWNARITAIEKALELAHEDAVRSPTTLDRAVTALKELIYTKIEVSDKIRDERFARVDAQFAQSDKLREQLAIANSTAIAAALQAAEKAVAASNSERIAATAKSDAAFAEQLKTLQALFTTETKNLNDKVNDLREQLARAQSALLTAREGKTDNRSDNMMYLALIGVGGTILGFGVANYRRRDRDVNVT